MVAFRFRFATFAALVALFALVLAPVSAAACALWTECEMMKSLSCCDKKERETAIKQGIDQNDRSEVPPVVTSQRETSSCCCLVGEKANFEIVHNSSGSTDIVSNQYVVVDVFAPPKQEEPSFMLKVVSPIVTKTIVLLL